MPIIYLSSTFEDLKNYRQVVFDALRKSGYEVIAMEDYVAADRRPVDQCLRDVEKADIYVGLFGFRYGYVPSADHSNPNDLSITELEYRHAEISKKPCLTFIAKKDAGISLDFVDAYTGEGDQGKQIERFRADLLNEKLASTFQSPHELASLVLAAVTKWLDENKSPGLAAPIRTEQLPEWPEGKSPYPGLEWFDKEYASLFFWRGREVDDVISKMSEPQGRFFVISWASGSRKSSLVAAGLWHALIKDQRLPGSQQWLWFRITPGDGVGPFESLAWGLKQLFPKILTKPVELANELARDFSLLSTLLATNITQDQELLLFVDQLEELFTQGFKDEDNRQFLEQLIATTRDSQSCLRVVCTIRSEFIGKLEESESVLEVLNAGYNYHLGPVSPRMLQEMIERPSESTGYTFESGLVEQILGEVKQEPGNLPLVAYMLKQLFDQREDRMFTNMTYQEMGGVVGRLARRPIKFWRY